MESVFLYLLMVPKRVLLSTLATSPVSFVQTCPPVLLQVFLHSGKLLSIPVSTSVVCPYFTPAPRLHELLRFRISSSWSQPRSVLFTRFPPLHLTLARKCRQCFLCFIKCPYSTETVVFKETLPHS